MLQKKIDFYYFTGTGNTLLVVKEMFRYFTDYNFEVTLNRIEKTNPENINPDHVIGLAFPVACQSTYPFIWKFMQNIPITETNTEVFMVDTLEAYSGGIIGPVKSLLKNKGYKTIGSKEIIMPSNFKTHKTSQEKIDKIVDKGLKEAKKFAHDLHYGVAKWKDIPILPDLLKKISLNPKTWKLMRRKMAIEINEVKCVNCELCYKLCPVDNIFMYEFPEMQDNCEYCMRCYNFCPTNAINLGNKNKRKYRAVNAREILNPIINIPEDLKE